MSVTIHTDLGDLKVELYCQQCPKTCENFLALAASGAYNRTKFHRNIPGFMVQGGDISGTGKGGTSIWGGTFEDEIHDNLRHNQRGVLSMANSGPNTNKVRILYNADEISDFFKHANYSRVRLNGQVGRMN
jgi:peptidyl-prolyl cis-trans isomerase-like 3